MTENTLNTSSGILINKFSDHQPYCTFLNDIKNKIHVPKFVEICKQDPDSLLKFQNDTAASLINDISNWDTKQEPNINYKKCMKLYNIIKKYTCQLN